nr:transposon Ty3-I Gag-Pol polyprotein [Tanacetum cinerariifolium]
MDLHAHRWMDGSCDGACASKHGLEEVFDFQLVGIFLFPTFILESGNDGLTVDKAFQEEDELEHAEPLDGGAKQVTYVVQCTLCSPKVSDSSQRNKIFQTKCLVKEKICSIIIDGGSCKNLVSKAMVKAFKLPTEPHPNPYQIGWIKKGLTLKVIEIYKVPLAIGKHYNELVTCDVVDMEACHVLLGRPWQYDVDATHQGKSNMYLFKWSGKTIAMLPLCVVSSKKKLKNKTLITLVASPKEFQAERKETGVSYALIVKGVEDVMKNAIPARNLPNLPHYRMSAKEFEILCEKIEELLKKGHIQESVSPCAVPALLTPKKDGSWRMCVNSRAINKIMEEHLGHLRKVMKALAHNDLFVNLKKCTFLTNKLLFLRYIVSSDGIHVDETKVQAVRDWPSPKTLSEAEEGFKIIKEKLTTSLVLSLPNFDNVFELECDACGTGIGAVLSQEGRPVAFHSALSRKTMLLVTISNEVVGFDSIKGLYTSLRSQLIKEVHAGGLIAHLGRDKTIASVEVDKHRWKKMFQVEDEVIEFLRKERFPVGIYSKLQPKKYGPYKILRKVNDNAYVVDLTNSMSISKTFKVSNVYEFHFEDVNEGKHLRTSSSKERGNDDDMIEELTEDYMEHLVRGKKMNNE